MSQQPYRAAPAFDADYFDLVNMVIQEEPINDYDKNMLGVASFIGIEKGKPFTPTEHQHKILEQVAKDVQNYLIEISAPFKFQLTVSVNPLAVVGWRCKPESL